MSVIDFVNGLLILAILFVVVGLQTLSDPDDREDGDGGG